MFLFTVNAESAIIVETEKEEASEIFRQLSLIAHSIPNPIPIERHESLKIVRRKFMSKSGHSMPKKSRKARVGTMEIVKR